MNWLGLVSGVGLALIVVGMLMVLVSVGELISRAIAKQDFHVSFWFPYGMILTGCLLIGGTP